MQLALRPYVTSGIALVGASVIAMSPISPVTPDIHVPSISTSSATVQLTASIDNPVDVFRPVFDQAGAVIQGFIATQAANPFPVLRQFIANQVESAAILRGYVEIVGRSLQVMVMNMPGVIQRGLQKSLAGDPATAFGDVLQGILLPAGSFVTELYRVYTVLQRPVAVFQELVAAAFTRPSNFILAVMTFGIPVIQQVIRSGQSIIDSVMTGDPVKMINAVQHGIADVASKGVTFAGGMLNQIKVIQTILTRAFKVRPPRLPNPTAASAVAPLAAAPETQAIAAGPSEIVIAGDAPSAASDDALDAAIASASTTLAVDAPSTEVTATDEVVETEPAVVDAGEQVVVVPATDATVITEVAAEAPVDETPVVDLEADVETEPTTLVRDSVQAKPGQLGLTKASEAGAGLAKSVRGEISKVANKIDEGIKKALGQPTKKAATQSAGSDSSDSASNE